MLLRQSVRQFISPFVGSVPYDFCNPVVLFYIVDRHWHVVVSGNNLIYIRDGERLRHVIKPLQSPRCTGV